MDWVKSCLAIVGIGALLLIGACVAGVGALQSLGKTVLDPQEASERVEKPEAEVKQAVYDYLDGVESGSFAERAKVEYMSDGTMQMHIGAAEPYDMTMKVAFAPDGARATKVTATYNADRLAWSQSTKTMSTNLHRCIRDDFERFAKRLGSGSSTSSLDLEDLIVRSRKTINSRTLQCDLSGPEGETIGDYETTTTSTLRDREADYTPPPPAFGKPDARMGKPTMETERD